MDYQSIITDVLQREGGSTVTNDPNDNGGKTQYGISQKTFPAAWTDGVVTEKEARQIYFDKFIKGPGFDQIPDSHEQVLRQLVDWSVTSGPYIAIASLQRALNLPHQDGIFGPNTLTSLIKTNPNVINNQLVKQRILMIGRVVHKAPSQVKWIDGWLQRALSFMV